MSQNNDHEKLSIQDAAELSGLTAHTIRAWEKRYQALTPLRNMSGRRIYSPKDIRRLIMLAQLTQFGSNIGQIANLTDDVLIEIHHRIVHNGGPAPKVPKSDQNLNPADFRGKILFAVENYKVDMFSELLSGAKTSFSPKVFALEILLPLMKEINKREFNEIQSLYAIAQFHAGSIIYSHGDRSSLTSQKILLTNLERMDRSFSLPVSALLCCHHKKNFYYLNTNLTSASIIEAAHATEANVLILNVPDGSNQGSIEEIINSLSIRMKIWLIGGALPQQLKSNRWNNVRYFENHQELDHALL